jgi:diguanylate cyclase (GGDEF)-like protein
MISIRKLLERDIEEVPDFCALAYLAIVEAVMAAALRCCPPTGELLKRELTGAVEALRQERNARNLKALQQKAIKSLRAWAEESETYLSRRTSDVKEMLAELASTADSIGKRDKRYTEQFQGITANLQSIAQLDDLGRMKGSILRSAGELRSCVDRMVHEGAETISNLQASLASHQVALEQTQELATLDPLTGLYNRREIEAKLTRKVSGQTPFCVVLIDLHNFKRINEQHGQLAGDEVLRQIAQELRMASRNQDILGRWGGDEFVIVIDSSFANTRVKVQRMRPWVFGTYEIDLGNGNKVKAMVDASVGIAEWSFGETLIELLSRADSDRRRDTAISSQPATHSEGPRSGSGSPPSSLVPSR